MTRIQKFSRPGVILMATVVAIITSIVVANATQTITTPNAAFVSYSLASLANSAPITPVSNRSVLVMGCSTNNAGVGQVSLLHIPSTEIQWVGLESRGGGITSGIATTGGTHIVWIDFSQQTDIRTASVDTIVIHNGNTSLTMVAGNVTLVW